MSFPSPPPVGPPIQLYNCGTEDCRPLHTFGPAMRDHYLIHCVVKGKGRYCVGEKAFSLHAGQAFVILPGALTIYQADKEDPWSYFWVGFNGHDAAYILQVLEMDISHPILTFENSRDFRSLAQALLKSYPYEGGSLSAIGDLYRFLSLLKPERRLTAFQPRSPASIALEYLNRNFSYDITIEDLAGHVGVSRSQLYRIFQKEVGISPQECLIQIRLRNADKLLATTALSVAEVMYSCGYQNPANFSKQFKKQFSRSPIKQKQMYHATGVPPPSP